MNEQRAVNPGWKVSIIPKDAGNATDPVVATSTELEAVIANPGSIKAPEPQIQVQTRTTEVTPRYNSNVPYHPQEIIYSAQDQEFMKIIHIAVANGWQGYHRWANDAVTIGMEPQAVITGMRKRNASAVELLLDPEFNQYVHGK
jgi:hypothetical protein